MDLTKEVIEKVEEMVAPQTVGFDGRVYVNKPLHPVKAPLAPTMRLASLDALVEFLMWDGLQLVDHVAEVESPQVVNVYGRVVAPWQERPLVASATFAEVTQFRFGQFMGQEPFVIGLQVGFVQDEVTAAILQLVGTIEDRKVLTAEDDGVTQRVTAAAGIARVASLPLPNPVQLRPYRTFAEIEQPASLYIMRAKSGAAEESMPTLALFEVENPAWRRTARQGIAAYLRAKLAGLTVLA